MDSQTQKQENSSMRQRKSSNHKRKNKKEKERNKKKYKINWKTRFKAAINTYLSIVLFTQSFQTLQPCGLQYTKLPCPLISLGVCSNSCPLSQWCHPTISSSVPSFFPPALNLFQHQGLFQWVGSSRQVAKVLELQLQHQSFQWIFRVDFL